MKKIILVIALFFGIFFTDTNIYANSGSSEEPTHVKTRVPTKVPWVDCVSKDKWLTYECSVPKSTRWVVKMLWNVLMWFTFITWIAWVLFIVINWILYSMWWVDQELKTKSKERIVKTLIWLVILFSSWYILQLIAPWVYK